MAFSLIATGDALLTQRMARNDPDLLALKAVFEAHDARFTNFELTVHDFEVSPSAVSGGTWVVARPAVVQDLNWLGCNLYGCATNHSLDWGHDGLQTTLRHLEEAGCIHAGIGRNLAEAAQPCYLETPKGRVALISVCSTAKDWHIAGEQRPDVRGRPGINMLRFNAVHYVPEEDIETLRAIVDGKTYANARQRVREQGGYAEPAKGFAIGSVRFDAGDAGTVTSCNSKDTARIVKSLHEATRQADVVLVSHHVHEFNGLDKTVPPDFAREFAHLCIDNGAHAYLGHGAHILRGVELYKNRPVFHGLGDFFFKNDSVERQPADFYAPYGLGPDSTPTDAFDARSGNGTRGFVVDKRIFEAVMPSFTVEDDAVVSLELIPITLGFGLKRSRRGMPKLASVEDGTRILGDLQNLSAAFGTVIEIENGRGRIKMA